MLKPSTASKSGAGLQPGDYEVTDAAIVIHKFVSQDPVKAAKALPPFVAMELTMQPIDAGTLEATEEDARVEYFKFGDTETFAPSEDGKKPVSKRPVVGDRGNYLVSLKAPDHTPNEKCKGMVFLTELINCGFDEEKMDDGTGENIQTLIGTKLHISQRKEKGGGEIGDYTVSFPDKMYVAGYDAEDAEEAPKKGKGAAAKGKPSPAPSPKAKGKKPVEAEAEVEDEDAEVAATELASELIGDMKNVNVAMVTLRRYMAKNEVSKEVSAFLSDREWVTAQLG